jgi:LmbE family N-acetylglucosaminyl deacetylase
MRIFELNRDLRWMFCMTHPDDEISICAWIKRLVENGNDVFLGWTHSNERREREARAVATLLGLPLNRLRFFRASDGGVVDEIPELIPQFSEWIRDVAPDRIACGAFEQGHIDHDATNYIVNQVYRGPVLEIPFYHTYLTRFQILNRFTDPEGQELLMLEPEEQRLKTHVARQYPSQNIWTILLWYEIWQKTKRRRPITLVQTERMRLQTHKDFLRPNHPPRLAGRVARSAAWRRWETSIRSYEQVAV